MQKKTRIIPLALVLALCMSLCANAATPRYKNHFTCTPNVTVSGNTAVCTLTVKAAESSAKITADIDVQVKTSSGSYTNIAGWTWTGTGTLSRSTSHTDARVSKGNTRMAYTITVVGSNGTDTVSGYVQG